MPFASPVPIPARLFSALPAAFRTPRHTAWSAANRGGQAIDSFLEGPCFDAAGRLLVTDIPNGRIFIIGSPTAWEVLAEYDGWPNGLALSPDGALTIADYRHGLLTLDPATGAIAPLLETLLSEGFRGLNDCTYAADGTVLFTDQGQTGLHTKSRGT